MAIIPANRTPFRYVEAEAVPVNNELNITADILQHTKEPYDLLTLVVKVGTFQFSSGQAVTVDSPSYTVGDTVPLISVSKTYPLNFKASAQNNAFEFSY